jgi:inosine/xanthosine triphosphate pyrophosphatase family protein
MAENIIANGQPRDHVATLKGLGVLADDSGLKVQIAVGVSLPGLPTQSEGPQKR